MARSDAANIKTMSRKAEEAADLMRALSNSARLKVLCELSGGERNVGELVRASGLSQSALSQHLARLREDGLVSTRRDAQVIYYRLTDTRVEQIVRLLFQLYCGKDQ